MKMRKLLALPISSIGMMMCVSTHAQQGGGNTQDAAKDHGNEIAEIIVTAQRREESLQTVPIAIAAMSFDSLLQSGVDSTADLKVAVPSLDVPLNQGIATPFIRGIGSRATGPGVENPVAFYVDGVYYAQGVNAMMKMRNIERIEVLKGPQGTLFGRNATGGLIQVVTRDPTDYFSGEANIGYANYDTLSGDLYLSGPISSSVKADMSGYFSNAGKGYGTNFFTGNEQYKFTHDYGFRSKVMISPTDNLTIRVTGDYSDLKNSAGSQRVAFGETPAPPGVPMNGGSAWDSDLNRDSMISVKQGGLATRVDYDTGGQQWVSISSYRQSKFDLDIDPDLTRRNIVLTSPRQKDQQFTQEFQMLSPSDSKINYVVGLYYFWTKSQYEDFRLDLGLAGIYNITNSSTTVNAIAPYAQATAEIFPSGRLTLGVRDNYERRTETGVVDTFLRATDVQTASVAFTSDPKISAHRPTWRAALDYQFTSDMMGYVSYNTGFKSGGYSLGNSTAPPYGPEKIVAYEVGLKSSWLQRRVVVNSAAWQYDYTNIQVNGQTATGLLVSNGARARSRGFEMDFQAKPLALLTLNGGYTYIDSEWRRYDNASIRTANPAGGYIASIGSVEGLDMPLSPHHVVTVGAVVDVPMGTNNLSLAANYYHSSGYVGEPDNVPYQGPYGLVNANLKFSMADDKFSVSLWGRNLSNEVYNQYPSMVTVTPAAVPTKTFTQRGFYAPPRTYGITFGAKF